MIRVKLLTTCRGIGVGVGFESVTSDTRTLSRRRSMLRVFSETSVKESVVELVLATKLKACGDHHVPVP